MSVETRSAASMTGLLVGGAAMFATMYSTQAILPELRDAFDVTPAQTGLTISVVVIAVAAAAWVWGPLSDRYGRKSSLTLASALLVLPTLGAALAPSFGWFLFFRTLQGLCMPGLLIVGVPYVAEVFAPELGGRAMGYYVSALVGGGLVGRVGVGLVSASVGWRWALGALALLPLASTLLMRRTLPEAPPAPRSERRRSAAADQLRNPAVLRPALAGGALFFTFVSVASYLTFRLTEPPFDYSTGTVSVLFVLWVLGGAGPFAGRLADRVGWRRVSLAGVLLAATGVLVSLPNQIVTVALAMGLVVLGMFTGVTAAQLGVTEAGEADRGTASAVYFSVYYLAGAAAGFIPGLAWQRWDWPGVAILALAVLSLGTLALCIRPLTRPS